MKVNPTIKPSIRPAHLLAGAVAALGTCFVFNAVAQPALEAPFTQVETGPLVTELGQWTSAAWGDYDNDGWPDLFVSNFSASGKNALFRNNRDGTFTKVTTGPIASETSPEVFGVAWGDYDNDGWLDLIITSNSRVFQPSRLYRNTGSGSFVRMTAADVGSLATDVSHAFGVTWGDYDRDGYLDLFVANGAPDIPQPDFLFHNERNGRFVRVTNSFTIPALATGYGAWVDINDDANMDLLLTHSATTNSLFRGDGQGQFLDITAAAGFFGSGGESLGVASGDYDNDGDLDVVVLNLGISGPIMRNWFYRNQGDGTFERITTGPVAEDQDHFVSASWVDYDNDGWLDLFVTILGPGSSAPGGVFNRLYHNQGDGTFVMVTTGSLVTKPGSAGGAAWVDYDGDGFLDVCVPYGTVFNAQRNALFRNNANANNWIKVRCVGTDSNRSAVGAKVRVKAKIGGVDRWQMRQIGCNHDWVAFNGLDAVIGLGDATVMDTLRVEWPSGRVQELYNVPVKQTLTIVERTDLTIAASGAGEVELTLKGPRQQRYQVEASTNMASWLPMTSLTITNVDGTATFKHQLMDDEPRMFFRARPE